MPEPTGRPSGTRSTVAAAVGAVATVALARATVHGGGALTAGRDGSPVRAADLEAGVVLLVTVVGTLAAAVVTVGCLLLSLAAGHAGAGRLGAGLLRTGSALTPSVLRRVLVVGVGLALVAPGAHAADVAPEDGARRPQLGWVVTTDVPGAVGGTSSRTPVGPSAERTGQAGPAAVAVAEPGPAPAAPERLSATGPAEVQTVAHAEPSLPTGPVATPVVVQAGDTLWAIARDHLPDGAADDAIATEWPRWYAANSDLIGPDPDLIRPGQHLLPPSVDLKEQS